VGLAGSHRSLNIRKRISLSLSLVQYILSLSLTHSTSFHSSSWQPITYSFFFLFFSFFFLFFFFFFFFSSFRLALRAGYLMFLICFLRGPCLTFTLPPIFPTLSYSSFLKLRSLPCISSCAFHGKRLFHISSFCSPGAQAAHIIISSANPLHFSSYPYYHTSTFPSTISFQPFLLNHNSSPLSFQYAGTF